MRRSFIVPFDMAINAMLIILSCVVLFHLFVFFQLLPYNIVGGGRLHNVSEMKGFEGAAILANAFLLFVIALRGHYIHLPVPARVITIVLWLFVVIFALNTVGNFFATTWTEIIIFTPLTIISTLLCYRLARGR